MNSTPTVNKLLNCVNDPRPRVREWAIQGLVRTAADDPVIRPALVEALRDALKTNVRSLTDRAVPIVAGSPFTARDVAFGQAQPTFDNLMHSYDTSGSDLLEDLDEEFYLLRKQLIRTLGSLRAQEAVPTLTDALTWTSPDTAKPSNHRQIEERIIQTDAAIALWQINPNAEYSGGLIQRFVEILGTLTAAEAVLNLIESDSAGLTERMLPLVSARLARLLSISSPNHETDTAVLHCISFLTKAGQSGLPLLKETMHRYPSRHVREAALRNLARLDPNPSGGVAVLVQALDTVDLQLTAIEMLAELGENARDAQPHLQRVAETASNEIRVAAAIALISIGSVSEAHTEVLLEGVTAEGYAGRKIQAALERLGSRAAFLIPRLVEKFLADESLFAVYQVLLAIGSQDACIISGFRQGLKSQHKYVRAFAASGLGKCGLRASSALPELVEALGDPFDDVIRNSAFTLCELCNNPEFERQLVIHLTADQSAKQRLLRSLRHGSPESCYEATRLAKRLVNQGLVVSFWQKVIWTLFG